MTTIELNNSYYLIITYFLRKFLSPFKLIPLEEYRILSSSSSSSSIRSVNENINFSNTNSKLLSLRKKKLFSSSSPIFQRFSRNLFFEPKSFFSKKYRRYFVMFFFSRDISRPRNGPREFRNRPPNFREEIFKDSPSSFRDSIYKYDLTKQKRSCTVGRSLTCLTCVIRSHNPIFLLVNMTLATSLLFHVPVIAPSTR